MSWRNAPSVAAALSQATKLWPNRSRLSDGTIGDAGHAARKSDHNPDARGVVHAFDITHDPAHGVDCEKLAAHLILKRDARVQYIIWNRRICESLGWAWRPYFGSNPHTKHLHVSIKHNSGAELDMREWWALLPATPKAAAPSPATPLRQGSRGTRARRIGSNFR